jgi:hypothetical protein
MLNRRLYHFLDSVQRFYKFKYCSDPNPASARFRHRPSPQADRTVDITVQEKAVALPTDDDGAVLWRAARTARHGGALGPHR